MSMMERGDIAMGFNQNKIVDDFTSSPTGGEIMITALDSNDTRNYRADQKSCSGYSKRFYER